MIHIGKRKVGDGAPCFITFEAGPTHDGLETAMRLIKMAAEAGADAIKFQILDADRLMANKKAEFAYGILADRGTNEIVTKKESLYEILRRRQLSADEWRKLKTYSDELGLAFFATVTFEDEVDLVADMGCQSIKIASADINHLPLIRHAARTGLCIQIDTGSSTIGEVERAVDNILAEGNKNIIIHHCPSGYPARLEGINLRVITTLKQMFGLPVAFSDHTPGREMDIAALALGANMLEKTITEDRMTPSVEHVMSLEPGEMRDFVKAVREMETALGSTRRLMTDAELEGREIGRRSMHATRNLSAGHILSADDVIFRRPGGGIPPDMLDVAEGSTLKIAVRESERIDWRHLGIS